MTLEQAKERKKELGRQKTICESLLVQATKDKADKDTLKRLKNAFDKVSKDYEYITKLVIELSKRA